MAVIVEPRADVVSVGLHMLYKLKTSKLFDESYRCRAAVNDDDDEFPFAVHRMHVCVDSRLLCVAGNSHVVLFNFSKLDASIDCPVRHHSFILHALYSPTMTSSIGLVVML